MSIRLVIPAPEHEAQALDFKQDFFEHDETVINGSEMLDCMDSYADWLSHITRNAHAETVSPDWVLTDTFFAMDEADRIVGIIDLRHELKGFLVDFGHAGYSVRPSERRKGYATAMLQLLKAHAKACGMDQLQLSVERSNAPSVKTIIRSGGVLQRSFEFQGEIADVYQVSL